MTRDEKGRFIKGNPGGGRLKRSTEEKYLAILRETITPEDWQDILRLQFEEMLADLRQREAA